MNAAERNKVYDIIERLEVVKDELEELGANEWEKFNNASENLQATERFQQIEEIATALEDALSSCEDLLDYLDNVVSI